MLITDTIKCFIRRKANITPSKLVIFYLLWLPAVSMADTIADELPKSLPTTLKEAKSISFPVPGPGTKDDSQDVSIKTPEYVIFQSTDEATFSSETAASVLSAPIKEGTSFRAGDILLQLDCRVQSADLSRAKAQLQAADMAYKSAMKLKSYGSISEFELTKAQSDQQAAKADVDKLTAITDKCVIKAPFNGSIAELMVHTNETVKPGDPLLKIVNTDNLELKMEVPSKWLKWLHPGSVFFVHVNETNERVEAYVTKISPEIDSVSQTVKIFGALKTADKHLRPGMSGQATFPENLADKTTGT